MALYHELWCLFRLQTVERVVYVEKRTPKKDKPSKEIEIHIEEGSKPEIYTEEDMKLLGDCKETWTLMVDGYGEDGERIYDPFYGKSCHQCRYCAFTLGILLGKTLHIS